MEKPMIVHTPQPVSCFSLPESFFDKDTKDSGARFWFDNYIYHRFGKKVVLNPNTKDHFIDSGKFLFVKIDLTYDKQTIVDEIDVLVQHAQKIIEKPCSSQTGHLNDLFDKIFSKIIVYKTKDKALEDVSTIFEGHGITLTPESLGRRYYGQWKKSHGINDLRSWRKQQKGDK
jgi:hypothetical protein